MTDAVLDADEQQVMDLVVEVMNRIQGWGLQANGDELARGVHVLQSFIIQHMLQRVAPGHWGEWYSGEMA